jgi:hypothetical protein
MVCPKKQLLSMGTKPALIKSVRFGEAANALDIRPQLVIDTFNLADELAGTRWRFSSHNETLDHYSAGYGL